MSEPLTKDEVLDLLGLIQADARGVNPVISDDKRASQIFAKLKDVHAALAKQEEQGGSLQPENFPATVDREADGQYNVLGQQLMLEAGKLRLSEGQQRKLSCIMAGMTSGLCQVLHAPRETFCNQLVTNVVFCALKAAYKEGVGLESGSDGH